MRVKKLYQNEIFVISIMCLFQGIFLLYAISNLSISYYEAEIFYEKKSLVSLIVNLSCEIFGRNDYALRIPFILIHFANAAMIYKISKFILKRRFDRVVATALFMALPALMSSAILLNPAGIIVFFTLLAIYFAKSEYNIALFVLLSVCALIDRAFFMLYVGFGIWALYTRKKELLLLCIALFSFSVIFYDVSSEGKPKGYFLDTVGVFAGAFSPLVFLFFIYTIYRIWIKEEKSLLWFIATSALCLTMLFSLRQRVALEMMLPYCVIATPLIIRVLFNSYRVRLPKFRTFHKIAVGVTLLSLAVSYFAVIFSDVMYEAMFANKPQRHFIYKFDVARQLASELKNRGVKSVSCEDERLCLRLKFYGLPSGSGAFIYADEPEYVSDHKNSIQNIDIYKRGVRIAKFYVKI